MNKMQEARMEKVTVNIGAGEAGPKLEKAKKLLEKITGKKPIETKTKKRIPSFKLRKGMVLGAKVTLRGEEAREFVKKALKARDEIILKRSFDSTGNVSFGVKEYIDFPGIKYDPDIGLLGFDVCVTLAKPGKRVEKRRIAPSKASKRQAVTKKEAMDFMEKEFSAKLAEEEE